MNVKPNPNARLLLSVAGVTVLLAGAGHSHDLRIFFGSWAVALVLFYVAGGGRRPWKIKWKDYVLYLLISVSLVVAIFLYAWYQARPSVR